eukprot:TRINITY_DN10189_c0_g1_i2.p1 TRINITY_DN10189_c0_g1~~TRINITY_DN10189_c0_g1_i2.p1  ORF type:complete len:340 (+),score=89.43 TRINITY_DN10189_c0_g1_i2:90-1022(+)
MGPTPGQPPAVSGAQPGYADYPALVAGHGLTVKQTMKGCCKECFGCEDTSEYRIADWQGIDAAGANSSSAFKMYALEESGACCRCCLCNCLGCTSGRALTINVSQFNAGDTEPVHMGEGVRGKGGPRVLQFRKPCSCPMLVRIPAEDGYIPIPCCCNLPSLETYDTKGTFLGSSQYVCDITCCVPKWLVYDSRRSLRYMVRPDTCCCGCCVRCRCGEGKKGSCFYEPMVLRDPATRAPVPVDGVPDGRGGQVTTQQAAVTKVWSGVKKECLSEADNFAVLYPAGIDDAMRANLLGLTFLVDFCWYEGNAE